MLDQTVSARLVFVSGPLPDQAELLDLAREVLTRTGAFGGQNPRLSGDGRMLYADGLCCWIDVIALPPEGGRVRVTMAREKLDAIGPASELPLVRLVVELVDRFSADRVEWLNSNASLSRAEVLSVLRYVSPRRGAATAQPDASGLPRPDLLDRLAHEMTARQTGPEFTGQIDARIDARIDGWDPAERNLARLQTPLGDASAALPPIKVAVPPASLALRTASWLITAVVATLSLPVASALACLAMARGSDFRLSTQALVLAGFFTILMV